MSDLEVALDRWLREHAPQHLGHHVQLGGGGVLCATCSLLDLMEHPHEVPEMAVA